MTQRIKSGRTRVVRVPDEIPGQVKQIAMLKGKTSAEILNEAWTLHMERHAERYAALAEALVADLHRQAGPQGAP